MLLSEVALGKDIRKEGALEGEKERTAGGNWLGLERFDEGLATNKGMHQK